MGLKELYERFPEHFFAYTEKILDTYFGNIFVTWRNEQILYCNANLARSVQMTKEEVTSLTLKELREKKLWLRSLSQEMYEGKAAPFNAYNVSKYGKELFTHIEPIYDEKGEVIMTSQFSIPKQMLEEFSTYIDAEKGRVDRYRDIARFLEDTRYANESLIRESTKTKQVFQDARYYAPLDGTVLLSGESGVGKEVVAGVIYHYSNRAKHPFVPVNCAAIPAELMESEFFGYEKGAFTGARADGKPGLFELAHKGTLFLDEIGELPLSMQAKLLRVLESGEYRRVGGTKTLQTDVRIIAATNRDLAKLVEEKKFREDLYYRLNVMLLHIPPLRERKEDILPLADLFLHRYNQKYRLHRTLTQENKSAMLTYPWPGNVRELRNIIERFSITGRLDIAKEQAREEAPEEAAQTGEDAFRGMPLHEACEAFEKSYIARALKEAGGSVEACAENLGIHRSLLYKKRKKYGI